jgi:hypothetical protein
MTEPRRPPTPASNQLHRKGGDVMKKFSVRKLETVKTTAALYGALRCAIVA